jgi:NAD(P)-dependent dehydrogenase (short-subunit alcohol dehydrogenase family)
MTFVDAEPKYDFSGLGFQPGQWAVVSGAASGIGLSVTRILVRSGVNVAAWDLDEQGLKELAHELDSGRSIVSTRVVDTADEADVEAAWSDVDDQAVQFLVNNAGPSSGSNLSVVEGVRQAVGGYATMTESFLNRHAQHASSIVFTASTAGNFMVAPTPDWYPTAKAAIAGYMRQLALRCKGAPRSNAVAPGATVTARTAAAFATPAMTERLASYPMGRAGRAWEVATVICFLLSPAASFVNGALIPVEGASTWI